MAANQPPEITAAEEDQNPSIDKSKIENRSRLIVRLGALLVSHSTLVSVICCIAGLIALLFLPMLAKNTYISENALMPGSANSILSYQDVAEANKLINDITNIVNDKKRSADMEIPKLIAQYMQTTGAEAYHHTFPKPKPHQFNPLHFFLSSPLQFNSSTTGTTTVGIIRAPGGDGKETIVLVSPYNLQSIRSGSGYKLSNSDSLALGLGFSVFSMLSRATWLSKDVIWVASDSKFGDYVAVNSWLNEYHNPNLGNFGRNPSPNLGDLGFKRAGTMAAAIVFKVVEERESERREKEERDEVVIKVEGSNGQMPNLDLVNVVHYLGVHRQGFRVRVGKLGFLERVKGVRVLGEIMKSVGALLKILNKDWKFDVSSGEYVEGFATLASSIFAQAIGVPTGTHGAFRDYQVDAVTLELSPRFSLNNENARSAFLLRGGRLIEGTVRSVNNLLEKFHQSFFLYFLTGPNKFISVGVYMIPFALLIAPLPILAAYLFNLNPNPNPKNPNPWRWLKPAKYSLIIHFWAVIVSLLPFYISKITNLPSNNAMIIWAWASTLSLFVLYQIFGYPNNNKIEWRLLKAIMIASVSIGLILMSIINFSTAQIGALFIVPMCLLARPIRGKMDNSLVRVIITSLNLIMVIIGFPLSGFLMREVINGNFIGVNLGVFWEYMEYLWGWNSATYLYIVLVHLPCWLLFVHVLLHPCSI